MQHRPADAITVMVAADLADLDVMVLADTGLGRVTVAAFVNSSCAPRARACEAAFLVGVARQSACNGGEIGSCRRRAGRWLKSAPGRLLRCGQRGPCRKRL